MMRGVKNRFGGRLQTKVAVVIGAARGIGEGISRNFSEERARVVVADKDIENARKIADDLNCKYGFGNALAVFVDVTDEETVKTMIAEVVAEFGGIDILVYSAGVVKAGGVKTFGLEDFEFVTKVNYTGYFLCVKHVSAVMAEQHKHDSSRISDIIHINSKSGLQGSESNFAYSGSKFGAIGLTQSFALELLKEGIKVNAVCPGNYFDGPLWSDPKVGLFVQYLGAGKVPGAKTIEDVRQFYESKIPMGKGCTIGDILTAVYYVIEQKYETGQTILVTGGQLMR